MKLSLFASVFAAAIFLPLAAHASTSAVSVAGIQMLWSKGDSYLRHDETVWGGNFSPDGKLVVTASGQVRGSDSIGRACVWDIAARKLVSTLQIPGCGAFYCSVFSPDGKSVLTSGERGLLVQWDPLTGKEIKIFDTGPVTSMEVKWFPCGTKVLTASQWGNKPGMHIWEVASGKIVASFKMDKGSVTSFDISADGKTIVTGDQNSEFSVRLWSTETMGALWEMPKAYLGESGGGAVWGVALSENGKYIGVATVEGCFILDTATGKILHRLTEIYNGSGVAFLPGDKHLLFAGHREGYVAKYDVETGKQVERTPILNGGLLGINLSKDKTMAVMGAFDHYARIIPTQDLTKRTADDQLPDNPLCSAVTPDGSRVITLHREGKICSWDAKTGDPAEDHAYASLRAEKPVLMKVSPNGKTLLIYDYAARAFLSLDLESGQTKRVQRSELDQHRIPLVEWVSANADKAYCVLQSGLAVLDLKAESLSLMDGLAITNRLTKLGIISTSQGVLFSESTRGIPWFSLFSAGASPRNSRFALDPGCVLSLCAATPDGVSLVAAEIGKGSQVRLALYSLLPEADAPPETIAALVATLGAPNFQDREVAQQKLSRLGRTAIPWLEKVSDTNDPEVKTRAAPLLAKLEKNVRDGVGPSAVVELCRGGASLIDLRVSIDGKRWVAVFSRSIIMGRMDVEHGTLSVIANCPLPGETFYASVIDDAKRCLTVRSDNSLTMWALNWNQ